MYATLCSCIRSQTLGSKSTLLYLMRTGFCCKQRYSTAQEGTHYDILELKRNCTPKEVRSAFIRLSKEFHPDKNPNNPALHEKFVQLNEAYSTLNDMNSRRNYDASLNFKTFKENFHVYRSERASTDGSHSERPEDWKEYYDFQAQVKRNQAIHVPNFLLKISTLSKAALVVFLVSIATALFGLQLLAVNYSNSLPKDIMTPKELEISRNLMMAKSDAQKYDLQENIDRFKQRVKESQMGRRDL